MKRILASLMLFASMAGAADLPRVCIEASKTVDAGNSQGARQIDFGAAISAAFQKKKVPVVVVTDPSKAQWTITSMSSQKEDSGGLAMAKLALCGLGCGGTTKFEGTIQVIDKGSSAVLYAYSVKKDNFQSAAEDFAKHFKSDYMEKRK